MAVIELLDDGPGLPPEVLSRLGLPAWPDRATPGTPATTSSPFDALEPSTGTGLGLPIAARLLALQGECLELVPGRLRGTRVRCVLPLA